MRSRGGFCADRRAIWVHACPRVWQSAWSPGGFERRQSQALPALGLRHRAEKSAGCVVTTVGRGSVGREGGQRIGAIFQHSPMSRIHTAPASACTHAAWPRSGHRAHFWLFFERAPARTTIHHPQRKYARWAWRCSFRGRAFVPRALSIGRRLTWPGSPRRVRFTPPTGVSFCLLASRARDAGHDYARGWWHRVDAGYTWRVFSARMDPPPRPDLKPRGGSFCRSSATCALF